MADSKYVGTSHEAEKVTSMGLDHLQDSKEKGPVDEATMDTEIAYFEVRYQHGKKPRFTYGEKNPAIFIYVLVAFASIGGLLSGLDQSLISGANLFLPQDLNLTANQASLVNSGMPLGAVAGALILSPPTNIWAVEWPL